MGFNKGAKAAAVVRLLLCVMVAGATGTAAKKRCAPGFEDATGVLLDEAGKPVDRASIELIPLEDFDSFTAPVRGGDDAANHYAKLAPDGNWSCPCLRKGAYEVQVHSHSYTTLVARGTTGTATRLTVHRNGAVVEGRLVVAPGVAANEVWASVELVPERSMSVQRHFRVYRRIKLEPDFSFKTPPLTDGSWVFKASDRKGRAVEYPFEVRQGRADRIDAPFKLAAIRGVVFGRDGGTVADAGVSAEAESMFAEIARSGCGTVIGRGGFRVKTDGEGRFVLADLSADEKYRLEAEGPDGESEPLENVPANAEGVKLVTVRSSEPGVLIVSAVGGRMPQIELRWPHRFPESETQRKGPVRFDHVWPGPVEVDVFAAGKAACSIQALVEPGKERALEPIALVAERPLTVRVQDDETGQPIIGARILLEDPLWQRAQVALDESARHRSGLPPEAATTSISVLHGLSPGPIALSVYAKGYAIVRVVAAPGQSVIDVRLKPHGPVAVTLFSRDGGVLQMPAAVEEGGVDGPTLRVLRGRAVLPLVDPGSHVLIQRKERLPKLFPAWFTSTPDGGEVSGYEAVGGAVLRVHAYSGFHSELYFVLEAGDLPEPKAQHPFWVLEQAAIKPTRRGQSGVKFEAVRPGTYTVLAIEPERRLGGTLRYHVWRRVLELEDGPVSIGLDSFERRPDFVTVWPPPDPVSPSPLD